MPRTPREIREFVQEHIEYPNFDFLIKGLDEDGRHLYLQVQCSGTCNVSEEPMLWRGRKWLISSHSTDGEIVQTAFLAVMTALEHEARENFKFKGQSILNPHYNPDMLWSLRIFPDSIVEREKA